MTNSPTAAYAKYVQTRHDFDEAARNLYALIQPICEVCTDFMDGDEITDVQICDDNVVVTVDDWTWGSRTYFFPKCYLDMSLDEIRKEIDDA